MLSSLLVKNAFSSYFAPNYSDCTFLYITGNMTGVNNIIRDNDGVECTFHVAVRDDIGNWIVWNTDIQYMSENR